MTTLDIDHATDRVASREHCTSIATGHECSPPARASRDVAGDRQWRHHFPQGDRSRSAELSGPQPGGELARSDYARSSSVNCCLQEARRLEIPVEQKEDGDGRKETEEDACLRALIEQEISIPEADEESLRRFYDNNRQRFMTSTSLRSPTHPCCSAA